MGAFQLEIGSRFFRAQEIESLFDRLFRDVQVVLTASHQTHGIQVENPNGQLGPLSVGGIEARSWIDPAIFEKELSAKVPL